MGEVKRALDGGALLEISTGDGGEPVIEITVAEGKILIYKSRLNPGALVVEVDDIDDITHAHDPQHATFPGVDRLPKVDQVHLYHNDHDVWGLFPEGLETT